ncbi:hypothetical protein RJ640_001843 [Escallonia rubra]|uniref:50S ribosomal protein L35 n=1 Tax=Escallonia rubra TaxID=112253 RepID=A0AA88SA54_9ASTE|nr:hypothetical protein RJ640_001843 [Escallonia rubra]
MQRWCTKLRSIAALHSLPQPQYSHRLLHSSPNLLHKPLARSVISPSFKPPFSAHSAPQLSPLGHAAPFPLAFMQVRHLTLKQRKRKLKCRKPPSPVVSKVKKVKMKSYSSYKGRFKILNDGTIRRWKEGKRHNAHLKSKKSKRRLRKPGVVPSAYAKVMKKLNFCG